MRAAPEMNRLFLAMLMMKGSDGDPLPRPPAKKAIHSERIRSLAVLVRLRYEWIFLPSTLPIFMPRLSPLPIRIKLFIMRDLRRKKEETLFVFLSLESPFSSSRRAILRTPRSILLRMKKVSSVER